MRQPRPKPSSEYVSYWRMRQRCESPRDVAYRRYGGRGITVCARWRESFANFLADMGPKPSPKHTLDRIDNDGNYELRNCRWASRAEQAANRAPSRCSTCREFGHFTPTCPQETAT